MFCSPEIRRPKPEGRRPKTEPRSALGFGLRISAFGLRASDFKVVGLRSSGLGFGMARTDFRAALRQGCCLEAHELPGNRNQPE